MQDLYHQPFFLQILDALSIPLSKVPNPRPQNHLESLDLQPSFAVRTGLPGS